MIHEFYRPWIYWEKSFALAPDASQRFARTVWRHQINHQDSLSFHLVPKVGLWERTSVAKLCFSGGVALHLGRCDHSPRSR